MDKKTALSFFAGAIISAVALYYALKNVPFGDLANYLATINYFWVVPSVAAIMVVFVLRAVRWKIILGSTRKIDFWRVFHPMMIGFMMNCILPARVGEFARPAILQKKDSVPYATGLATVAAERVFDSILIITMFVLVIVTLLQNPDIKDIRFGEYHLNKDVFKAAGRIVIIGFLFLTTGIILIRIQKTRQLITAMILNLPQLFIFTGSRFKTMIENRICVPLVRIPDKFSAGFDLLKQPGQLIACLFLTIAIWSLNALSFYIMSIGAPGIDLSYPQQYSAMIIICIFIALPSVPGFWGLWEAGGVFALSLFGIAAGDAAGFTLANHAVQMFPVILTGVVSAVVTGVNILHVSQQGKPAVNSKGN